ncbi:MAG: alpha/beta hydrolase [Polyangiaceae bacterium]|nr:alpha/beta hydrolase [Polyangiaceae bacterium]
MTHALPAPPRSPSLATPLALAVLAGACAPDFADLVPRTVDEDPSLPALELAGTRLHLATYGAPTRGVVIGLHGGPGGDHRSLASLATLADDGYLVVLWDQRGAGLSRRHACEDVTARQYLRDLEAVVDRFAPAGAAPLFFVGHSWGAMYATWYVNEHPERARGAVLLEPGGLTSGEVAEFFGRLLERAAFSEEMNDSLWMSGLLTPDSHARADLQAAGQFAAASEALGMSQAEPAPFWRAGGIAARCLPASQRDFDWTTRLTEFPHEVLFLTGDRNQVLRYDHVRARAAHYPRARITVIPGVGHDLHWAARERFLGLTREYLAEQVAAGGGR